MKSIAAFFSDSVLSLGFHAAKSLVALLVNWWVLTRFEVADYVTWSVTASVITVATASDLGIGQYAVTRLIHTNRNQWQVVIGECLLALVPLALIAMAFVYLFVGGTSIPYKLTMSVVLGLRIMTIPFGAALNAMNQFKVRKAIELGVYLLIFVLIVGVTHEGMSVEWALMVLNGAFLMGGLVSIGMAGRYFALDGLLGVNKQRNQLLNVYRMSVPFMINNILGVLTYGGFLWISSFFLSQNSMAKLAVLHTFVLMNLYQVYDVYLKSRQADLLKPAHVQRLRTVNALAMLSVPLAMGLLGMDAWNSFLPNMTIGWPELMTFALFMALELGFLFIQSLSQVNWAAAGWLSHYAVAKFVFQLLAVALYWLFPLGDDLTGYVGWLVVCSAVAYFGIAVHHEASLRAMRSGRMGG